MINGKAKNLSREHLRRMPVQMLHEFTRISFPIRENSRHRAHRVNSRQRSFDLALNPVKTGEPKKHNDYYLPNTEIIAREVLSLPLYPELTEEQIRRVSQVLIDFDT